MRVCYYYHDTKQVLARVTNDAGNFRFLIGTGEKNNPRISWKWETITDDEIVASRLIETMMENGFFKLNGGNS